ncbi:SDR family NAD(P)-dependent oxidoreductase [Sphingobium sp. AN558]|uniref:SDR family NAD(P)-dependent oxidoreductase n=1 Tax=Sphingobium sp. AN558 TaxID=3133442 RepID=UPI0030BE7E14
MSDVAGPWAVIAGGSEGIGEAFAKELASRGINLVLIARTITTLAAVAEDVRSSYPAIEVRIMSVDLSSLDAVDMIADQTSALEVGTLVYNVGSETDYADFLDHSREAINSRLIRNVNTKVGLVHHFGGLMRTRRKGSIVLMGSVSGYNGAPGFALYAASKALSRYFTEGIWYEFKQDNVNVLCPVVGPTDTPTMRRAYGEFKTKPTDPAYVARASLDQIANGPIWISEDMRERIANVDAMAPGERATAAAARGAAFANKNPTAVA